jgi:hypothetical protein
MRFEAINAEMNKNIDERQTGRNMAPECSIQLPYRTSPISEIEGKLELFDRVLLEKRFNYRGKLCPMRKKL